MRYLFNHAHLVIDGNKEYIDGALLVEDEHIEEVYHNANKLNIEGDYKEIDCNGLLIFPGFFDTHTHGIDRMSFDDCSLEEMDKISYEFAKSGTTSYLGSISYDCLPKDYDARFELLNGYETKYARVVGIHMEGPFSLKRKRGTERRICKAAGF